MFAKVRYYLLKTNNDHVLPTIANSLSHDDVIKWKHFPRNWPFVRGIHRSPVNSPHKGQWRGTFMFSLICARINGWVNNGKAGDLRRYRAHYDAIVMRCERNLDIESSYSRWEHNSLLLFVSYQAPNHIIMPVMVIERCPNMVILTKLYGLVNSNAQ